LYFGCHSDALRADFSHWAPVPAFDRLVEMGKSQAPDGDLRSGRHEHARGQMEFGHARSRGMCAAAQQCIHHPSSRNPVAMDDLVLGPSKRSSSNPREYRKSMQTLFQRLLRNVLIARSAREDPGRF
jgi:hypothetical protein